MKKKFPAWKEQIKSPKWQKKRLEVLNLRGFKCEECGNEDKTLHVHHRFYINGRLIHEYDNDVLQVLCEDCHKKEHNKPIVNTNLYKSIHRYLDQHQEDPSDHIAFILNCICANGIFSDFLINLTNAFNSEFAEKINSDLDMRSRLEYHEMKINEIII